MKATISGLGALLGAALLPSVLLAQCYAPVPTAPDMCGPGYYCVNNCGLIYGPNHCVYPPFPPFQGMLPGPKPPPGAGGPGGCVVGPGGIIYPAFPSHPFARSPRDFFMDP